MKIPKSVKINGIDYKIEKVSGLNDGENILFGLFDEQEETIKINTHNQESQNQCRTLLHEVCHAILYENDTKGLGYDSRIPKDEETLCELFARGFYQFLQDNVSQLYDLKE